MRVHPTRRPAPVGRPLAVLTAGIVLAATATTAAQAADTTTSFTLGAGALAISAPATANLGTAATGTANLSASLGAVQVTDARGALLGTWTATVSSTDFTTGGVTANETVTKANVAYASLPATA